MAVSDFKEVHKVERLSRIKPFHFEQDWYDAAKADHFWMSQRFEFLQEAVDACNLPREAQWKVLDVGSGDGVIRDQVERHTSWVVDCADIDETALRRIPPGRGRILLYDILEGHQKQLKRYDAILMMDVLEHIENPVPFLESALRHLRKGGYLIINVPALQSLFSPYDHAVGHVKRYSSSSLLEELNRFRMRRIYMKYWGLTLVPLLFARKALLERMKDRNATIRLGFKPSHPLVNRMLSLMLTMERICLRWRPLGSSLLYVGQISERE